MVVGLGCEKLVPEKLLQGTEDTQAIPVDSASIVRLQDEQHVGFRSMVDDILQVAERHLAKLNQRKRETCPASELVVGMQCGGSDAFSGVTANPAVGYASDLLVPLRRHGNVFGSDRSAGCHSPAHAARHQRRGGQTPAGRDGLVR
ncbi:D-galactarate dehydratase [Leclercia adecarboxylata]|uniref:D-galactarate dehydratase n=1 Tax=Leclercia adecarboxylata TaxID=83655 RepID=A0A4U9IU35_9ENTR|nr:D-galactarate dehydratase [Leclercia adecarboxylata]